MHFIAFYKEYYAFLWILCHFLISTISVCLLIENIFHWTKQWSHVKKTNLQILNSIKYSTYVSCACFMIELVSSSPLQSHLMLFQPLDLSCKLKCNIFVLLYNHSSCLFMLMCFNLLLSSKKSLKHGKLSFKFSYSSIFAFSMFLYVYNSKLPLIFAILKSCLLTVSVTSHNNCAVLHHLTTPVASCVFLISA